MGEQGGDMMAVVFRIEGAVRGEMGDRKGEQSGADRRFQMLWLTRHEITSVGAPPADWPTKIGRRSWSAASPWRSWGLLLLWRLRGSGQMFQRPRAPGIRGQRKPAHAGGKPWKRTN